MAVEIREVQTRCQLREFIEFANRLYKDCQYYCPPIFFDEMNCFNPKKNPALEVCDHKLWMAYRDGKPVGRIVGIINRRANEHWNVRKVRFGWFDFIDDMEVSHALLDTVAEWGKSHGMDELNGPVGFTDFDHEGLLLEGYEYRAPLASLYNYPYYVKHVDAYGLTKEADWIEMQLFPGTKCPERVDRVANIVKERSRVHVVKVKNVRELNRRFGHTYMDVIDAAYQKLYNFQPMTRRQKDYYIGMYLPLLNFDFVTIVANEKDECIGVGLGMPEISSAVRRCNGRLFPFGWFYMLRALRAKKLEAFNFLLLAIRPDYQNKGIDTLFMQDLVPRFSQYGLTTLETTSMLETNNKILDFFSVLEHKQHKRRRAYIKPL